MDADRKLQLPQKNSLAGHYYPQIGLPWLAPCYEALAEALGGKEKSPSEIAASILQHLGFDRNMGKIQRLITLLIARELLRRTLLASRVRHEEVDRFATVWDETIASQTRIMKGSGI